MVVADYSFSVGVVVEHVRQDVLGVLESLGHLCVVAFQGYVQRQSLPFALLIDICDQPVLRVEQYLRVILETHLHYFIAESEHYGMLRPHPLLHIYRRR